MIPSFNGLRGIGAISIVLSHAILKSHLPAETQKFLRVFVISHSILILFFVLSGFLITHILLKEERKFGTILIRDFFLKRYLRFLPPYYALLFTYFLISWFGIVNFTSCNWLSSLTFTKNFGCRSWMDGHLWSFAVEQQFYLVWPFIFKFCSNKIRQYALLFFIILTPLSKLLLEIYLDKGIAEYSFTSTMGYISVGCLCAIHLDEILVVLRKLNTKLVKTVVIGIIFIIHVLALYNKLPFFFYPFRGLILSICWAYLMLSYGFLSNGPVFKFLNNRYLAQIGMMSFSIYLWQQMFFDEALKPFDNVGLSILVIIPVSMASYYCIERPVLKLRNKFLKPSLKPPVGVSLVS